MQGNKNTDTTRAIRHVNKKRHIYKQIHTSCLVRIMSAIVVAHRIVLSRLTAQSHTNKKCHHQRSTFWSVWWWFIRLFEFWTRAPTCVLNVWFLFVFSRCICVHTSNQWVLTSLGFSVNKVRLMVVIVSWLQATGQAANGVWIGMVIRILIDLVYWLGLLYVF